MVLIVSVPVHSFSFTFSRQLQNLGSYASISCYKTIYQIDCFSICNKWRSGKGIQAFEPMNLPGYIRICTCIEVFDLLT